MTCSSWCLTVTMVTTLFQTQAMHTLSFDLTGSYCVISMSKIKLIKLRTASNCSCYCWWHVCAMLTGPCIWTSLVHASLPGGSQCVRSSHVLRVVTGSLVLLFCFSAPTSLMKKMWQHLENVITIMVMDIIIKVSSSCSSETLKNQAIIILVNLWLMSCHGDQLPVHVVTKVHVHVI